MTINKNQLAAKYDVSSRTITNWINSGNFSVTRNPITKRVIWDKNTVENLEQFVRQNNEKTSVQKSQPGFSIENRRYLGAKSRMLDFIQEVVQNHTNDVNKVADIFGGTGVVANMFYQQNKDVIINDILDSNYIAYETFFSHSNFNTNKIELLIRQMNELPLKNNYVSENYGNKFFSTENAKKIGEAREFIEQQQLNERERAILLTSLVYAMDKVANTVGHYDAYRRIMDTTAPIVFKKPNIFNGTSKAKLYQEDANQLVRHITADLVYIDTPYNSRQYGDVYHVLENIVDWQKPELYGVAMKPKDRSKTKSDYSTSKAPLAFDDLIQHISSKYILVSYNNMAHKGTGRSNAKISNDEIMKILSKRGHVVRYELPFQAYTTGKTTLTNHKEYLYLVNVETEAKIND